MVIHKVRGLLAGILSVDQEDITSRMTLSKSSGINPIDIASLIISCEKEFHLTIHDEDVAFFKTVADLASYIDRKIDDGLCETPEVTEEDRTAWFYE